MFDIGASEFLLIVIVAIVVIGPKDLPRAMRLAGQWIAKARRISGHFRAGIETMIREAELEEMERKWREQNEAIMKAHPPALDAIAAAPAETTLPAPSASAGHAAEAQPEAHSLPPP
jgi:sec-independent protein translocase protein TatB